MEGNVYCGGSGGLWILDPKGKKLGRIVHGEPATTNMAFGGDDWKTLYFTTRNRLHSVNVKDSWRSRSGAEKVIGDSSLIVGLTISKSVMGSFASNLSHAKTA